MNNLVWIPAEKCFGFVESQMAYGAIVRYEKAGIEFQELLTDEDYEHFTGFGHILINMEEDEDD